MRKATLIFLFLLVLFILTGWWALRRAQPPRVTLADGSVLTLLDRRTGPYEDLENPEPTPLRRFLQKMPGPIRNLFGMTAALKNNRGRSYYTHAYQENSLHLWFSLFQDGQPMNPSRFRETVFLRDKRDWIYQSYGLAKNGSGTYTHPELNCSSFSAFPRWDSSFWVVVFPGKAEGLAGTLPLENPDPQSAPETNWTTHPIPQETERDGTVFQLVSLEPGHPPYWGRKFKEIGLRVPPHWKIDFTSRDPDGVSNAWHEIRSSYFDNYGNHSLNGLPSRLNAQDDPANLQWKIELVTAADHRSQVASNFFWELPVMKLPGTGRMAPLSNTNLSWNSLDLRMCVLAGSGILTFTNESFEKLESPDYEITGESWSSTTRRDGTNQIRLVEQTKKDPHLTFNVEGSYTNFHYSCRAVDPNDGSTVWLHTSSHAKPGKEPRFFQKHNEGDLINFGCNSLEEGRPYVFIFGAHTTRIIDFFIEAPVFDPNAEETGP